MSKIQYNSHNNSLIGDKETNTLTVLPNHFIERPRPETIESGENYLEATLPFGRSGTLRNDFPCLLRSC